MSCNARLRPDSGRCQSWDNMKNLRYWQPYVGVQ